MADHDSDHEDHQDDSLNNSGDEDDHRVQEELTDTLFLRNVSRFETTQDSLQAHMEENWGETVYCLICKDRETGESKGTAFVKFKDIESAATCLEDFEDRECQTKFFLDGRNLFVLPALTRDQIGEVKKASTKKDDTQDSEKKKFKKHRHHRIKVKDVEPSKNKEKIYSTEVAIKKGNSKKRKENKLKKKGNNNKEFDKRPNNNNKKFSSNRKQSFSTKPNRGNVSSKGRPQKGPSNKKKFKSKK